MHLRDHSRAGRTLSIGFMVLSASSSLFAAVASDSLPAGEPAFHLGRFLGPFHSAVVHFPIGFFTAAFILEIFRLRRPSAELLAASRLILWLGVASGLVAATFGWLRADGGAYETEAVAWHRAFGLSVPLLILMCVLASYRATRQGIIKRSWNYLYGAALCATMGLIAATGHLGGNLTHGSSHLFEHAPAFVRNFLLHPASAVTQAGSSNVEHAFYLKKVQPIFAAKCYQCHGSEKHKSGYRLDQADIALKGGDSGKTAITPGDPGESNLVRLILLPSDSDDVMPPRGKQSLTSDEILTILTWIQNGAAFAP